jgi:hypothetical protein
MEKDTKGKGHIYASFMEEKAPSITYQAVIFEKLFGGIGELKLDQMAERTYDEIAATLGEYMVSKIEANPGLFDMILKYFVKQKLEEGEADWKTNEEKRTTKTRELVNHFYFRLGSCCIYPVYEGKLQGAQTSAIMASLESVEPLRELVVSAVKRGMEAA